jgi:hypothetical protein
MSDAVAAIVGAATGAVITLAGVIVQIASGNRAEAERRREARETEREQRRTALVQRYLFQLQDGVQSLRLRFVNLARRGGRSWSESVDPGYWDVTTLYALGRALAAERILALEGVHTAIDQQFPGLGTYLKQSSVDRILHDGLRRLFYYHRLALAESAFAREPEGYRLLTYTEWRRRYEDPTSGLDRLLAPAKASLHLLNSEKELTEALIEPLTNIVSRLETATGVAASPAGEKPAGDSDK